MDDVVRWSDYETGEDDARDIIEQGDNTLLGIRAAVDNYSNNKNLSNPGQLSYKFGYLNAIIDALVEERSAVREDLINTYVERKTEDDREQRGDQEGTDAGAEGEDPERQEGDI